jgi:serine/threonine protein kinase
MIEDKKHIEFWDVRAGDVKLSDEVKKLIVGMFAHNPDERYTMDKISKDPWVKGIKATHTITEVQKEFTERISDIRNKQKKRKRDLKKMRKEN